MEPAEFTQTLNETYAVSAEQRALRNLVMSRRSTRRYVGGAIDRRLMEELLLWASWAPSAHNRQPWRFCVVTDADLKRRLAQKMGERWAADLRTDGVDDAIIERRVSASVARVTGASAAILVNLCMDDMDTYNDATRQAAEHTMAAQSVALSIQNLLLAAHAHGLGACWMCSPLFAPDTIRDTLELPATWEPQALVTVGYPAEVRTSVRQPLESRVIWK